MDDFDSLASSVGQDLPLELTSSSPMDMANLTMGLAANQVNQSWKLVGDDLDTLKRQGQDSWNLLNDELDSWKRDGEDTLRLLNDQVDVWKRDGQEQVKEVANWLEAHLPLILAILIVLVVGLCSICYCCLCCLLCPSFALRSCKSICSCCCCCCCSKGESTSTRSSSKSYDAPFSALGHCPYHRGVNSINSRGWTAV